MLCILDFKILSCSIIWEKVNKSRIAGNEDISRGRGFEIIKYSVEEWRE
jgi:hypothetical protein